ncbi:MAG: hypothetical protein MI976_25790, partial [Pseudomonadales bacterium]|nr:hypothetical protein [Pseudomonadales bacterium]
MLKQANNKTSRIILILISSILAACSANVNEVVQSPNAAPNNPLPLYEQVVAMLLGSDEVIAPRPKVYPVQTVYNREAIIPPMCYTRTESKNNPCYVCHQDALPGRENVMNDADLQEAYSFSDLGMTNHWHNLFKDRSDRVAAITDADILEWVNTDNYSELAPRLREYGFNGWIPDLQNLHLAADAFDEQGFAKDGSHWVAYNYKP